MAKTRMRRLLRLVVFPFILTSLFFHLWIPQQYSYFDSYALKQTSQEENAARGHRPQYFNNLTNCIARGYNFMNPNSGCRIASWVYSKGAKKKFIDCGFKSRHLEDPSSLQPWDTVYVPYKSLQNFSQAILRNVTVPFVLLSGQFHVVSNNRIPQTVTAQVLESEFVVHWFGHSINFHNALTDLHNLTHKLSPLAFGLQPFNYQPPFRPGPMEKYQQIMERYLTLPEKTIDVFEPYLRPWSNPKRANIPSGTKLPIEEYLELVAKSRYVLSPDGDRPECYRHYEALGLGAIPITELDPLHYRHLAPGPILYNNTKWWNLTHDEILDRLGLKKFPEVNRNMVFEEYWMEYMEGIVGVPLRWFDHRQGKRAYLANFTMVVNSSATENAS